MDNLPGSIDGWRPVKPGGGSTPGHTPAAGRTNQNGMVPADARCLTPAAGLTFTTSALTSPDLTPGGGAGGDNGWAGAAVSDRSGGGELASSDAPDTAATISLASAKHSSIALTFSPGVSGRRCWTRAP